jgi:hypothetical protein
MTATANLPAVSEAASFTARGSVAPVEKSLGSNALQGNRADRRSGEDRRGVNARVQKPSQSETSAAPEWNASTHSAGFAAQVLGQVMGHGARDVSRAKAVYRGGRANDATGAAVDLVA